MNPLMIDFAGRRLPNRLALTAFLAATLGCAAALWEYQSETLVAEELAVKASEATSLREGADALQISSRAEPMSASAIDSINQAIGQMNLPWGELFGIFESQQNPNLALLALEPDGRMQTLKVLAEAKAPEDMADFFETLLAEKRFSRVLLTKHETNDQDPNRPIRFVLIANWGTHRATPAGDDE